MLRTRRPWARALAIFVVVSLGLFKLFSYWRLPAPLSTLRLPQMSKDLSLLDKVVVLGKRRSEDVSWLRDICRHHDYTAIVYSTDSWGEKGCLTPRSYRGREAPVYLSYILDYYDALPKYTVFVHDAKEQWHNDITNKLTPNALKQIRFDAVAAHGFANLRCKEEPGCGPPELHPGKINVPAGSTYLQSRLLEMYMQIFDVTADKVPKDIGAACCGQFAVTREQIRKRPREDYERMLRWTQQTSIANDFGVGWVFEKFWHIVFSMDAVTCPVYEQCRCDLYGWCGPLKSGRTYVPVDRKKNPREL
ncbi:Hypothetical protein R9X50_00757500 [Acrodontium crateriforme]|uniref:DUF3431 domain containing protein n=1 Tax=Acrodontium crateriforme TaxID=150365 RepID=A0AAQ3ME11_9PEZI|nr:Hypothetical protein R9X50_00757500 [Acrodontium crateriforme]